MGTTLSANEVQVLTVGAGNSGLYLIANQTGVTIELYDPGTTTATTFVGLTAAKAVRVTLRYSAGITATAEEVRYALAKFATQFFVDVSNVGDGTGVVIALAPTSVPYPSAFPMGVVSPNPGEVVRAGGGVGTIFVIYGNTVNGDVQIVAKVANVRIQFLGGISQTLAIAGVNGTDLSVQLGTNGAGTVISTAASVVALINGDMAAFGLVTASFGGDGSDIASVLANYMAISAGPIGSVRPPLEVLTSRTALLKLIWKSWHTFRGMVLDGVGDILSDVPAGELHIRKVPGNIAPRLKFTFGKLIWSNLDAEGNPAASYSPQSNEMCAKSICKAWFSASTDGAGHFTIHDAWNVQNVNVDGPNNFSVDFKRSFNDSTYVGTFTGITPGGTPMTFGVNLGDKSVGTMAVLAGPPALALGTLAGYHIMGIFFGKQP